MYEDLYDDDPRDQAADVLHMFSAFLVWFYAKLPLDKATTLFVVHHTMESVKELQELSQLGTDMFVDKEEELLEARRELKRASDFITAQAEEALEFMYQHQPQWTVDFMQRLERSRR